MQVPIIRGIYSDANSDYRTQYPRNLIPVPKQQGISNGYLRPAHGIVEFSDGSGPDRGGINWNDICYRVMGQRLVRVESDGEIIVVGEIVGTNRVKMDYSFDDLSIVAGGKLYLYNETDGLRSNEDPDLSPNGRLIIDALWLDGYHVFCDGEFIGVTELNDPLSVNPLKYGSSEIDPDPIVALLKNRNEIVSLNRHTIEFFDNVGGFVTRP